jgi:hypothetical protein
MRAISASRRTRGEDGASLILALAFLLVFAILIPAILDLGTTNVLSTSRLKSQRSTTYEADGAMDGAIQYLRLHPACGRPATVCPESSFQTNLNDGTAATVTWSAVDPDPFKLDRDVSLVSTVDGTPRVNARVVIRDSSTADLPPVDVKSWQYVR